MAINNPVITDSDWLQAAAVAIQNKDGGDKIEVPDFASRIENITVAPVPVQNPALILWDWDGTKLAEYSREDALALTELPPPNSLAPYVGVAHDLLLFQEWNWSLEDIKEWVQGHKNIALDVGAIYTTTDGKNYPDWPSLHSKIDSKAISSYKQGTLSLGDHAFDSRWGLRNISLPNGIETTGDYVFTANYSLNNLFLPKTLKSIGKNFLGNCTALKKMCLPVNVETISNGAFERCTALHEIILPSKLTSIGDYAFLGCLTLYKISIPPLVKSIGNNLFFECRNLYDIFINGTPILSSTNAFTYLPSTYRIYVPRAKLSWFETETNWSSVYADGHVVATEDYIDYLESIGFDVEQYKEVA